MNIWETIAPRPKEIFLPHIGTTYYRHCIQETIQTNPHLWLKQFDAIQNRLKQDGYRVPNRDDFLETTDSKYLIFSPYQQWAHENAHVDFAKKNHVSAAIYLSHVLVSTSCMTWMPWVALDVSQMDNVPDLREFMGGFLDAPGRLGIGYTLEKKVADYLLGRSHPDDMKLFISENA